MSIDQFIACRSRPSLPDDLPGRVRWERQEFKDYVHYEHDGGSWLIHVGFETDAKFESEMLSEAFANEVPRGACMVGVTLEPVTRDVAAIALLDEVIAALENKCGGIALPV